MSALDLIDTDGKRLDTVTLNAGKLAYVTGKARSLLAGWAPRGFDDTATFDLLSEGWSNGYVSLVPQETDHP